MARPLRIQYEGAWYHVMNRGAGNKNIFYDDYHKILFLELLSQIHSRYHIEIHSYCLMSNHYHLLVRTPLGNLSRAMRHLDGVYTQKFNRHTGTDGSLFRGRYKSILIESNSYLLQLSRYIHLNPVQAKIVSNPELFIWSSYLAFLNTTPRPLWLYCDEILNQFSQKYKEQAYHRFVQQGVDQEILTLFRSSEQKSILGSEHFIEQVTEKFLINKEIDREIPEIKKICVAGLPTITDIIQVVTVYFVIDFEKILKKTSGKSNMFKQIAVYLSVTETQAKLVDISILFGLSYSAVSKIYNRIRRSLLTETNMEIKHHVEKIIEILATFKT